MCKTPKMPKVEVPEPQYLRNPFLDDARGQSGVVNALRLGRSALTIPLDTGNGVGFTGQGGAAASSETAGPRGNATPRRGRTPRGSGLSVSSSGATSGTSGGSTGGVRNDSRVPINRQAR